MIHIHNRRQKNIFDRHTIRIYTWLYMNEDKIIEKIINLEEDVSIIKEKLSSMDGKMGLLDTVIEGQDHIIGMLKHMTTEMAATNHALRRHEDRIETAENRMDKLEKDVGVIKMHLHLA